MPKWSKAHTNGTVMRKRNGKYVRWYRAGLLTMGQ